MSIVGPRPERPEIAAEYEKEMPEFRLRLQARAGLTGYILNLTINYEENIKSLAWFQKLNLIMAIRLLNHLSNIVMA